MQAIKTYQMPSWLAKSLFYGLSAILILLPFHAFLSTWGGASIGPLWLWKSWKELLLALLVLMTIGWLITVPAVVKQLARQWLVRLLAGYLVLVLVLGVLHLKDNGTAAVSAGLAMDMRYLAAGALAYLLFMYGGLEKSWVIRAARYVAAVGVFLGIFGILQVLVLPSDFLAHFGYDKYKTIAPASLIDNNPNLLRAFATLRGPNDFGAFLILPTLLIIAHFRKMPQWLGVSALATLGWALLLSSSRSAWLGAIAAVAVYAALRLGKKLSRRQIGVAAVSIVFMGFLAIFASINVPAVRMAVFHSSPHDPTLTEGSTDNHIAATLGGIERVADNPLGCGAGCAGPASYYGNEPKISENYPVQIAEESGVVGVLLFVSLVGIMAVRLYRAQALRDLSYVLLAALAGYVMIGLLLHVWADDPLSITWWLLAGAVLGYNESTKWIKSKDSSHSKT